MLEGATAVAFRIPRVAYLVVIFVAAGIWPFALYGGHDSPDAAGPAALSPLVLLYLIPIVAIFYIVRTATIVTSESITVRALFGRRTLPWDDVRGLSVTGRSVYAVLSDGSVRLPCVRVASLSVVAAASGGRLPPIARPTPKFAPSRRRR